MGRPFPKWPLEDGNLISTETVKGEYYVRKDMLHNVTNRKAKKLLKIPWYHKRGKVDIKTFSTKRIGAPITTTMLDFDDAPERPT